MERTIVISTILLILYLYVPMFSFPLVYANENFWTQKSPIPSQLEAHVQAGVVNGKIYIIGKSVNFEYNPETEVWTEKTPMPSQRDSFGLTVWQNKIYVIGGNQWTQEHGVIYHRTNEVYDPFTDTWEIKEPMPTNGTFGLWKSTNTVNGKIHLICEDFHNIYDIATDSWSIGSPMPIFHAYTRFSSTVIDDKIYLLGGDATQIYDPKSETWSFGVTSPNGIYLSSACATTGVMAPKKIYVFGKATNVFIGVYDSTNITQVYDPIINTWTLGAPMLTPRSSPCCAVVNDIIYVIGGSTAEQYARTTYELVNEQYYPIDYIPEFSLWLILPISLVITIVGIIFRKKIIKKGKME